MNKSKLIAGVAVLILMIAGGAYWGLTNKAQNAPAGGQEVLQSPITPGSGSPQPGGAYDLPVEPAAAAARKDLAAKLSIDEKSIVILQIDPKTWTDGCLGLGGPAESCIQALVEGFRVELLASSKSYFYRTDKTGAVVRMEGGADN